MFGFVVVLMVSKVAGETFVCNEGFSVTEIFETFELEAEAAAQFEALTELLYFDTLVFGTVPNDFTNFTALEIVKTLDLGGNDITGSLPDIFAGVPSLLLLSLKK